MRRWSVHLVIGAACCAAVSPLRAELQVGYDAPSLAITKWVKGDPVDLSEAKGKKVVVVEFWATWCGPCIASMPHLTEVQKHYADSGLVVVAVTRPDPNNALEKVEQFVKDNPEKMGYTVAFDGDSATNEAYMKAAGQNGIPTSFIIDRAGKVAWIGHPMDMDRPLSLVMADKHDIDLFKLTASLQSRVNQKRRAQAWDEVLRALEALSALNPDDADPWCERVSLYAGQLSAPDKAAAAAEQAARLGWESGDAMESLASTIRYTRGNDALWAIGIKAANRALELKPDSAAARLTLIDVLAAAGKTDEALQSAREALELIASREPAQLNAMVRTLTQPQMKGKGLDLARQAAEAALTKGWDNATTMTVLAFSLRSVQVSRDFQPLAVKAARRAVELKPQEGRSYLTLIDALLAADQATEALEAAEKNSELLLQQDANLLAGLARSLASPKLAGKGSALAMKLLETAVAAQPDNSILLDTRFRVEALGLKDRSAALTTGEFLLEKASNEAGALNSFAWSLLTDEGLKGQFNELALKAALKCHEVSGGQVWAYVDTLALAKFETGARQEAVELERKALELARKAGITNVAELEAALARFEEGAKLATGPQEPARAK